MRLMHTHIKYKIIIHASNTTFHVVPEILMMLKTCYEIHKNLHNGKGKAVPLQTRCGPEGSRKIRFPDFMKTAQDVGKVVSITHRPPLPPGNTPGTHFC